MTAPEPSTDLTVPWDLLVANLGETHAAQLTAANLDGARWRAAAIAAAVEIATLRERLTAAELASQAAAETAVAPTSTRRRRTPTIPAELSREPAHEPAHEPALNGAPSLRKDHS